MIGQKPAVIGEGLNSAGCKAVGKAVGVKVNDEGFLLHEDTSVLVSMALKFTGQGGLLQYMPRNPV